jgi:thiosulfate reductase cytochrome b subunit
MASVPSAAASIRTANLPAIRHAVTIRVTHWITTVAFAALFVSGIAILLAHPRLYWGETGSVGTPSLIDLPFPFVLDVPIRGPGRYIHFLAAWIFVLTGCLYVLSGLLTLHFRRNFVPSGDDLSWARISRVAASHLRLRAATDESLTYNVLQRIAYLSVVFVLAPLMIWTGLAMSPSVTSVLPFLATVFGGQQSARTIHFFAAFGLVLFFVIHVTMVSVSGFSVRMRAMITGEAAARQEVE